MIKIPAYLPQSAVLLLVIFLSACGGRADNAQMLEIERPAPSAEYAGRNNPLARDAAAIEAGKQVYAANCAACHGDEAMGDGPAANSLNPKPMPLATEMNVLQDDYIYWRIAEGGAYSPFTSAMPAWKSILSEDEIWQVIAFMHTLAQ